MKKLLLAFCGLASFHLIAYADESKPTSDSVRKFLEVSQAKKTLENVQTVITESVKQQMQTSVVGSLGSRPMTLEQRQFLAQLMDKIIAASLEDLNWETFEPIMEKVYIDSFSQEEIDQMTEFYGSPGGQAMIKKMPLVMQNTMKEMQVPMQRSMKHMNELVAQSLKELKEKAATEPAFQSPSPFPKSSAM